MRTHDPTLTTGTILENSTLITGMGAGTTITA